MSKTKNSNTKNNNKSDNNKSDNNKSNIVGNLFYTFGTIFLAAVIAVCVINYIKDGSAAQAAFLPETSVTSVSSATAAPPAAPVASPAPNAPAALAGHSSSVIHQQP